jgi:hypothetical protein
MKNTASKKLWTLAALMGGFTIGSFATLSSSADENNNGNNNSGHESERWAPEFHGRDSHASRRGYFLGVCVGQTLAQQGISVPVPQPGEKPTFDATTEAAMKSAAEACRSEMQGTTASPSPSGAPSTTPSTGTSPAPTESVIPAPSEPVIPTPTSS